MARGNRAERKRISSVAEEADDEEVVSGWLPKPIPRESPDDRLRALEALFELADMVRSPDAPPLPSPLPNPKKTRGR